MIKDWRSRCASCPNFEEVWNVEEDDMSTTGAPFLRHTKGAMELPDVNTYNIQGPQFPLCVVKESQRRDSFTSSNDSTHTFITQSNFPNIMDGSKFTSSDSKESRTARFVTGLVRNSRFMSKVFREKCNEAINSGKQETKNLFFKFLGCAKV